MSRGMGRLQRTVLSIIEAEDRLFDTFEITATAYAIKRDENGNRWVSDAQHAAVRRALIRLGEQGKIATIGRRFPDGRRRWANIQYAPPENFGGAMSSRYLAESTGVSASTFDRVRRRRR